MCNRFNTFFVQNIIKSFQYTVHDNSTPGIQWSFSMSSPIFHSTVPKLMWVCYSVSAWYAQTLWYIRWSVCKWHYKSLSVYKKEYHTNWKTINPFFINKCNQVSVCMKPKSMTINEAWTRTNITSKHEQMKLLSPFWMNPSCTYSTSERC